MAKLTAFLTVILLSLAAVAQAVTFTKIGLINSGPDSNRVKIVIAAEGYTAAQQQQFVSDMNSSLAYFFGGGGANDEPYGRYHNFFNVYGLFTPSTNSGFGGYFGSSLYGDRTAMIDTGIVHSAIASQFPTANWTAAAINTTTYCGGGYWGGPACFGAENGSTPEVLLHESGHSWHYLQDTYVIGSGAYTYGESSLNSYANVTTNSSGSKWSAWMGYNQDPTGDTVGAYSGAYYPSGVYAPTINSKMTYLYDPFDAVCREKIIQDIYSIVKPLDSYTNNSGTLVDPALLSVSPVDNSVIAVSWTIDGKSVTPANQDLLSLSSMHLTKGLHTITALAHDPTDWVIRGTGPLSESISWTVNVTVPEPSALVLLAVASISLLAFACGRKRLG